MQRIMREKKTEKNGMQGVDRTNQATVRGHPNESKSSQKLIELI